MFALFALLSDKKETTYHGLFALLKSWRSFWSPKLIKVGFETVVITAIHKVFPDSEITGCNFPCIMYRDN